VFSASPITVIGCPVVSTSTIPTGNMKAPAVAIQKWMALLSVALMLLFGVNLLRARGN